MKNFKKPNFSALVLIMLTFLSLSSCDTREDMTNDGAPPVIERVSPSANEDGSPTNLPSVEVGFANNVYIIQGSGFATVQKIYFNDTDTYFNPVFVSDTAILVTIDINTPYADASDQLRIVTLNGTAVYNFVVAPPAPLVTSFNPINAAAGDVITIYGSFFLDPVVTIDGVTLPVIASTLTQIQVAMPAGANNELVAVTTISGTSTATQPIGTAIYDDAPASFVENYLGPWDGSGFTVNTEFKVQGASSIAATFTGYTGFKFPMFATPAPTAGYSGIRVSFKSTKETGKFKIVLNGNYGGGKEVSFTSSWTTFYIPFAELGGAPAAINEIVFQEFNNDGGDMLYIDDVGFELAN